MAKHAMHHMDRPAVHGMLIVGDSTVYLSHLPMFMSPHDYQAIFEVTFSGENAPETRYRDDRHESGATLYTFVPEAFSLPELDMSDPARSPRQSFEGEIFRHHFERPNDQHPEAPEPVSLGAATATVTKIVQFRKLMPPTKSLPDLTYVLFGKQPELFLAHFVTQPPDIDQFLLVSMTANPRITDEVLRNGVVVDFPDRANTESRKIRPGESVSGIAHVADEDVPVQLRAEVESYSEAGELAV